MGNSQTRSNFNFKKNQVPSLSGREVCSSQLVETINSQPLSSIIESLGKGSLACLSFLSFQDCQNLSIALSTIQLPLVPEGVPFTLTWQKMYECFSNVIPLYAKALCLKSFHISLLHSSGGPLEWNSSDSPIPIEAIDIILGVCAGKYNTNQKYSLKKALAMVGDYTFPAISYLSNRNGDWLQLATDMERWNKCRLLTIIERSPASDSANWGNTDLRSVLLCPNVAYRLISRLHAKETLSSKSFYPYRSIYYMGASNEDPPWSTRMGWRARLVDWMKNLTIHFSLSSEVLNGAIDLADSCIALLSNHLNRSHMQLLYLTSLSICAQIHGFSPRIISSIRDIAPDYTAGDFRAGDNQIYWCLSRRTKESLNEFEEKLINPTTAKQLEQTGQLIINTGGVLFIPADFVRDYNELLSVTPTSFANDLMGFFCLPWREASSSFLLQALNIARMEWETQKWSPVVIAAACVYLSLRACGLWIEGKSSTRAAAYAHSQWLSCVESSLHIDLVSMRDCAQFITSRAPDNSIFRTIQLVLPPSLSKPFVLTSVESVVDSVTPKSVDLKNDGLIGTCPNLMKYLPSDKTDVEDDPTFIPSQGGLCVDTSLADDISPNLAQRAYNFSLLSVLPKSSVPPAGIAGNALHRALQDVVAEMGVDMETILLKRLEMDESKERRDNSDNGLAAAAAVAVAAAFKFDSELHMPSRPSSGIGRDDIDLKDAESVEYHRAMGENRDASAGDRNAVIVETVSQRLDRIYAEYGALVTTASNPVVVPLSAEDKGLVAPYASDSVVPYPQRNTSSGRDSQPDVHGSNENCFSNPEGLRLRMSNAAPASLGARLGSRDSSPREQQQMSSSPFLTQGRAARSSVSAYPSAQREDEESQYKEDFVDSASLLQQRLLIVEQFIQQNPAFVESLRKHNKLRLAQGNPSLSKSPSNSPSVSHSQSPSQSCTNLADNRSRQLYIVPAMMGHEDSKDRAVENRVVNTSEKTDSEVRGRSRAVITRSSSDMRTRSSSSGRNYAKCPPLHRAGSPMVISKPIKRDEIENENEGSSPVKDLTNTHSPVPYFPSYNNPCKSASHSLRKEQFSEDIVHFIGDESCAPEFSSAGTEKVNTASKLSHSNEIAARTVLPHEIELRTPTNHQETPLRVEENLLSVQSSLPKVGAKRSAVELPVLDVLADSQGSSIVSTPPASLEGGTASKLVSQGLHHSASLNSNGCTRSGRKRAADPVSCLSGICSDQNCSSGHAAFAVVVDDRILGVRSESSSINRRLDSLALNPSLGSAPVAAAAASGFGPQLQGSNTAGSFTCRDSMSNTDSIRSTRLRLG